MELLISMVLLSLIVLGISNIEVFCKYIFTGADRKAKIINEASYVAEHMSKFLAGAVGDSNNSAVNLTYPLGCCTRAVQAWVDYNDTGNLNGIKDAGDRVIMYCFNTTAKTLTYYPNYTVSLPGSSELLARNILNFDANVSRNTVNVTITECWNANITTGPRGCGSVDNPNVTIQTRIYMPSVTANATP